MSGHSWWPSESKDSWHKEDKWQMWHSPTYEDKRASRERSSSWSKPWSNWDWGSPTGALPVKKKLFSSPEKSEKEKAPLPVLDIPQEFESDARYLDKNKRFGKDFPRTITTSSWSVKNQLQGREITSIALHEMCYLGIHNVSLRYLAHGFPTSIVLTRGVKESILGEKLMKEIRGLGTDIDVLSKLVVEKETGSSLDTSSLELKTEAIAKFASIMVAKTVRDFPELSMNLKRVRELEDELRDGQVNKKSKESEPESADVKVFKDTAPTSHTSKAVSKWIDGLQLSKEQKKKLDGDADRLSKFEPSDLQAKLLERGLPMKTVAAMKKSDLGIMVAAGYLLAAKKV